MEFSAVKILTAVEVSFNHYQEPLLSLPISQPIHQATKTEREGNPLPDYFLFQIKITTEEASQRLEPLGSQV